MIGRLLVCMGVLVMGDAKANASDAARAAVVRNGLACDDPPLRLVPGRRRTRAAQEPVIISAAAREQYEYEFRELLFKRLDAGMTENCGSKSIMPECCAHHATLAELGCLEFWDVLYGHLYDADAEVRRVA